MFAETAAGFGVGLLVGMTGVGGGALMTPILILFFGYSPLTAVGTDLLFASITKSVGMLVHGRQGTVDWIVVRRLAAGSIPAAVLALVWLTEIRDTVSASLLFGLIGSALLLSSLGLLAKSQLHRLGKHYRLAFPSRFKHLQPALTVFAGILIGVFVTATSIGAGALGAVVLLYLYPLRLTPAKLVGTDLAHAIPLALVAGMGHLAIGTVEFRLLGGLLLGSLPGVLMGSWLCGRMPESTVRMAVAVALGAVAVKLLALA